MGGSVIRKYEINDETSIEKGKELQYDWANKIIIGTIEQKIGKNLAYELGD